MVYINATIPDIARHWDQKVLALGYQLPQNAIEPHSSVFLRNEYSESLSPQGSQMGC